jgi:hypothetical protein
MPTRLMALWTWKYTPIGLSAGLIALLVLGYGYSPRLQVKHTLNTLARQDFAALDPRLQQAIRHSMVAQPSTPTPAWEGLGQRYLHKMWPTIKQQVEPSQLFLLQTSQYLANQQMEQGYVDFPNTYVLKLGQPAIEFYWQRQGWADWQIEVVCSQQPHPLVTLQTCPSAKR